MVEESARNFRLTVHNFFLNDVYVCIYKTSGLIN